MYEKLKIEMKMKMTMRMKMTMKILKVKINSYPLFFSSSYKHFPSHLLLNPSKSHLASPFFSFLFLIINHSFLIAFGFTTTTTTTITTTLNTKNPHQRNFFIRDEVSFFVFFGAGGISRASINNKLFIHSFIK